MVTARVGGVVVLCAFLAAVAAGQERPSRPRSAGPPSAASQAGEAPALARGWGLLASGRYREALGEAQRVFDEHPRSVHALALAIEATLLSSGAAAGLDAYEAWIGQRPLEEPGVLRRIAREMVLDAATVPATRGAAVLALEAAGEAVPPLRARPTKAGADSRALSAAGDEAATQTLLTQLRSGQGDPVFTLQALGDSGNEAALGGVLSQAGSLRPEVRGAAADALGKLGAGSRQAEDALHRLLEDQSPFVRLRAAGALHRLGDPAGLPVIREFAGGEEPMSRLAAADAMSSRPDTEWMSLVSTLAQSDNPDVRLGAASLVAPYDPDLARRAAESLTGDPNPAIRGIAQRLYAEVAPEGGLSALRALLRDPQPMTRLRAAGRILVLTR